MEGDGDDDIRVYNFVTRETNVINPSKQSRSKQIIKSGHGGGDYELMEAFVYACVSGDKRYIISGAEETFGKLNINMFQWEPPIVKFL